MILYEFCMDDSVKNDKKTNKKKRFSGRYYLI